MTSISMDGKRAQLPLALIRVFHPPTTFGNHRLLRYVLLLILLIGSGTQLELDAQAAARHTFTHYQMGTQFRIILYSPSEARAQTLAQAAFQTLDQLNARLSDYLPESELNQLCAKAGTASKSSVSADLWQVLRLSKKISRKSKGTFDVSIGPITKIWRKAFQQRSFPADSTIREALQKVNYKWIRIDPNAPRVALLKEGMQLDLGGIAKGYAADKMAEIFREAGHTQFLIDAGGDLLLGAPPPEKEGWKIAIANQSGQAPTPLSHCAVATSGDTYQFLEWEGKRYSHIIDPRTGYGLINQWQVTVIAPTAALADALASAVSVLGEKKGNRLVRKFRNCTATFQSPMGKSLETSPKR